MCVCLDMLYLCVYIGQRLMFSVVLNHSVSEFLISSLLVMEFTKFVEFIGGDEVMNWCFLILGLLLL